MKLYKLLPHTADTRLYVESDTLTGLFEAALEGMASIIKKSKIKNLPRWPASQRGEQAGQKLEVAKEIKLESPDVTSLLIDFLSEVLTYSQEEKVVFSQAEFLKFSENSLEAKVLGERVDEFDEDIKAVTYHEAEIKKNDKGDYETIIIFDI